MAKARELHSKAQRSSRAADKLRDERDVLIRRLREEDPVEWTYDQLARQVGCSPELIARICHGRRH